MGKCIYVDLCDNYSDMFLLDTFYHCTVSQRGYIIDSSSCYLDHDLYLQVCTGRMLQKQSLDLKTALGEETGLLRSSFKDLKPLAIAALVGLS